MDLEVIRAGIQTRLLTVFERVHTEAPGSVNPPCAVITPDPETFIEYVDLDGTVELSFVIHVIVSQASSRTAQKALDDYLVSVPAAFDTTPTGVTDYAVVTDPGDYGEIVWAGASYYGVEFPLEVSTR